MAVFVSSTDASRPSWLLSHLKGFSPSEIKDKQKFLAKVCEFFLMVFQIFSCFDVKIFRFNLLSFWKLNCVTDFLMNVIVQNFQYSRHFLYSSPAQPLGPEDLTWRMVCKSDCSLCVVLWTLARLQNRLLDIRNSADFRNMPQIAGKLVNIKLHIRRSQRIVEGSRSICTCECRRSNSSIPGSLSW